MTERDAFKIGFLRRCAAEGMTPDAMLASAEKAAAFVKAAFDPVGAVAGLGSSLVKTVGGVGNTLLSFGIPVAAAAPVVAGGAMGYGAAKAMDVGDTDVAEVKDRELVDEYGRQTERLRRQKALRDYRQALAGRGFHRR